jgi:hypothetical protein
LGKVFPWGASSSSVFGLDSPGKIFLLNCPKLASVVEAG